MSDLSRLIDDLCAGLYEPEGAPLSGSPETLSGVEILQQPDSIGNSWSFRSFRPRNEPFSQDGPFEHKISCFSFDGSRATSSPVKALERPETPERGAKTLAGSGSFLFPVEREEPERPERDGTPCERPTLDLNGAAPLRSGWWTGAATAEADGLAPYPRTVGTSSAAHVSGPAEWRDGLARLDRWAPPCPGFRTGEWDALHGAIAHFMDHAAAEASRLGWTAVDLFGVHRDAGAAAVDSCGALMLPLLKTVSAVSADAIAFGPLVYRRRPMPQAVVAWDFAGGDWREGTE